LRSWLKLVISLGATKLKTVHVDTVPLNNFQVTPPTEAVPIWDPAGPAPPFAESQTMTS